MHMIIELLPLVFGFCIALLHWFTKASRLKNGLFMCLGVAGGIAVNRLNGESFEFMVVDIFTTTVSTLVFIMLGKYMAKA